MSPNDSPWLVVGLGNPGPTYAATRHNVGYMVCDVTAGRMGASWRAHKSGRADVVEGRLSPGIDGPRVVLARSRSYMNDSGGAVSTLASFYKIPAARIIAVHDELDLGFGTLRVKFAGGDNGHNGLKSMRLSLATGDFYRVRVGIGRPPGRQSAADFVLKSFSPTERRDLGVELETAADAVETIMSEGLVAAQNRFN